MPELSSSAFTARARKIRLFAMDVDGVLTDGSIVILNSGEEVKFWNVKDRIGFFLLNRSGQRYYIAWITGRESAQVKTRAREIGVDALYQRCADKGKALLEVLRRFHLRPDQSLFLGDDWVDLPALHRAGLAVCPSDAHETVKRACHRVTRAAGGKGAFREVVDWVLRAQGLWNKVLRRYENPRA